MKDFWLEFGINSAITALSAVIQSKVHSEGLKQAALTATEALHQFLDAWREEKAQVKETKANK